MGDRASDDDDDPQGVILSGRDVLPQCHWYRQILGRNVAVLILVTLISRPSALQSSSDRKKAKSGRGRDRGSNDDRPCRLGFRPRYTFAVMASASSTRDGSGSDDRGSGTRDDDSAAKSSASQTSSDRKMANSVQY